MYVIIKIAITLDVEIMKTMYRVFTFWTKSVWSEYVKLYFNENKQVIEIMDIPTPAPFHSFKRKKKYIPLI